LFVRARHLALAQANMIKHLGRFDRRVSFHLVLAGAVLLAPAQASSERPARPVAVPAPAPVVASPAVSESRLDAAGWPAAELGGIDPKVFAIALDAAAAAVARGTAEPATLTVIDFSKPSTAERMWVYDLRSRELLFEEAVAHGRNSGHDLTTSFSNAPESNKSSLGLFRTAETYVGKHGYSLRLDGLEPGVNDRARERAIVIHGADYVNLATARTQGRLGRSLGCPAVRPEISKPLIDAVKDGGLLFAYYPDTDWLATSTFLN
jgi:hypothetical protein